MAFLYRSTVLAFLIALMMDVNNAEQITGANNESITIKCNDNYAIVLMPIGDVCLDSDPGTLPCGHQLDRALLEECNLKRRCEPVLSNVPEGRTLEITYYCTIASRIYDICHPATIRTEMGGFYLTSEAYPKGGSTRSCSCSAKITDSIPIKVNFRDMFFKDFATRDRKEYLEVCWNDEKLPVVQNCKNMDINNANYQLGGKTTDGSPAHEVAIKYTRKNSPVKADPALFVMQITGPAALEWSCNEDNSTTTTFKMNTTSPASFEDPTTEFFNRTASLTTSEDPTTPLYEFTTVESPLEGTTTPTLKSTDYVQSSTAAIEVTAAPDTDGNSGALIEGIAYIVAGILLFVVLHVAIAILWGRKRRRRTKSNANSSGDLYDDTMLSPHGGRQPPNQGTSWGEDNAAFSGVNDEEYTELGSRTPPTVKNIYSLQLPPPDSRSVSSGEQTPVYHILEPGGPQSPLYYELESELSNRFKKGAGDEIYTSLQPTESGTQTPVYQSLQPDNTSGPVFSTLSKESQYQLENIAIDTNPEVQIEDRAPNLGEYALVSSEQGPKEAQGNHQAMPNISVDDTGVDSCDSVPFSYDYVCDIETQQGQSDFHSLDNGDVYLELVADDQVHKDNRSLDRYDYVQDVEKMPNSGKSGQGQKCSELACEDQSSNERHEDGNLETNNDNPNIYLHLMADSEDVNDQYMYLKPKASNQKEEDDHSSVEYDYTYSGQDKSMLSSGGQGKN